MLKKITNLFIQKFSHALKGLGLAFLKDRGFQFQIIFLIITVPIICFIFSPLAITELALLTIVYGLLFITELQNTALETALDKLHPTNHKSIKDSKDLAAGSVLLSLIVFLVIVFLFSVERGIF